MGSLTLRTFGSNDVMVLGERDDLFASFLFLLRRRKIINAARSTQNAIPETIPTMTAVAGKEFSSFEDSSEIAASSEGKSDEAGSVDDDDVDEDDGDAVDDVIDEIGSLMSLRKVHIPD